MENKFDLIHSKCYNVEVRYHSKYKPKTFHICAPNAKSARSIARYITKYTLEQNGEYDIKYTCRCEGENEEIKGGIYIPVDAVKFLLSKIENTKQNV